MTSEVNLPANCPTCNAALDWSNDETDLAGCRFCGGVMCWKCGSMPEGICNKCGQKMFDADRRETNSATTPTGEKEGERG